MTSFVIFLPSELISIMIDGTKKDSFVLVWNSFRKCSCTIIQRKQTKLRVEGVPRAGGRYVSVHLPSCRVSTYFS